MIFKNGICSDCGRFNKFAKPSKKLCAKCNRVRLNLNKNETVPGRKSQKPTSGLQKPKRWDRTKRRPTGELALFKKLCSEREMICEKCGAAIHSFNPSNFHHIKPKGRFPELRLVESNIQILCFNCHFNHHNN